MQKILLILSFLVIFSCTREITKPVEDYETNPEIPGQDFTPPNVEVVYGEKPLTKNIPSIDIYIKKGTHVGEKSLVKQSSEPGIADYYNLLERLYSTIWYESNKDKDDSSPLDDNVEFIVFESDPSRMYRRFYKKSGGLIDNPNDGTSSFVVLNSSYETAPNSNLIYSRNAVLVENIKIDNGIDTEYEGFYLKSSNVLYVVKNDDKAVVENSLLNAINGTSDINVKKYVLSVVPIEK